MTNPVLGDRVPVLRGHPFFGSMAELRDDYLQTLLRAAREVGPVARIDAGPPGWRGSLYSVSAPHLVDEVLGRPETFTKDEPGYREIRQALGDSMLTSEGDRWLRQRRMLAPIFTPRRIAASYVQIMVEETQLLVDRWRGSADTESVVDVNEEMVELASRIIGRILFGSDMAEAMPQLMRVQFVNEELLRRTVAPHATPMWIPTPNNRRLSVRLREIKLVVADLIARRRAGRSDRVGDDMLGLLLTATDVQTGGQLSDDEITEQVLIFLIAGHDTSATTLSCTLVELARSSHWQSVVQSELDQVLADAPPQASSPLPWINRVIRESMRLYPAAHSIGRSPPRDALLGGYRIPAGASVIVSPWAVHRSAEVWPDPDVFDPRRFDLPAGTVPGGHRHAFVPFGTGPRTCVGMQLATIEATIVVATIFQQLRLTTRLTSVPVQAAVTLRPAGSQPVSVHTRAR